MPRAKPLTPAAAVRQARTAAGLTQTHLAELCGITQSALSQIERGVIPPNAELALRVAAATNTDPAAILPGLPWSAACRKTN